MRTIETARLILRDWEESDLDDMFAIMSDKRVTAPQGQKPIPSKEKCAELLHYLMQVKNNYALECKVTGAVIGMIGVNKEAKGSPEADTRNIGYCLSASFWNQGYMSEALSAVIEHASEYTKRLSATVYQNPASEHLLDKFGFRRVGEIKNVNRSGEDTPHDEPYFILEL